MGIGLTSPGRELASVFSHVFGAKQRYGRNREVRVVLSVKDFTFVVMKENLQNGSSASCSETTEKQRDPVNKYRSVGEV